MKCKIHQNYQKYIPKFDNFSKNTLNLNLNNFEDQQEFGKACSYFINQNKCKHQTNKHENIRHIVFSILKFSYLFLLLVYVALLFFPGHMFESHILKSIDDKIENVLILFSAIVLIYFFIPSYPRPILSKTDNLITFSSGIILFIIGFKNIFFST